MNRQQGFTLVELVIVIVILGILAATAIPRFVDLSGDAEAAALKGVANSMGSAMTINYAGCTVNNHAPLAGKCVAIADCDEVGTILTSGLPAGYTVASAALAANGTTANCTVTQTSSSDTETFLGIGAGN